jgi:hypothetical protein
MLTQMDQKIIKALKELLVNLAEDRLQAVIVYGSRVWGGVDC